MIIAITFRDDMADKQLWYGSGIAQNLKFYYDLFEVMGYEVFFLGGNDEDLIYESKTYRKVSRQKAYDDKLGIDLIIEAGTSLSDRDQQIFRDISGCKIVGLRCGHQYNIAQEGVFLKKNLPENLYNRGQDKMWILPHYLRSKAFIETMHNCEAVTVPYLWEPDFVDKRFVGQDYKGVNYRHIAVMEPNISTAKNALIPMAILAALYRKKPDAFESAKILNSLDFFDKPYFVKNIVSNLEVLQGNKEKVYFLGRHPIHQVFSQPGVLLGHQHHNELNYLYNEALYMGIPLVHNSPDYRDVGYYYEDFDVDGGVETLLQALNYKYSDQLQRVNEKFLYQWSIYNPEVQSRYNRLIKELFK